MCIIAAFGEETSVSIRRGGISCVVGSVAEQDFSGLTAAQLAAVGYVFISFRETSGKSPGWVLNLQTFFFFTQHIVHDDHMRIKEAVLYLIMKKFVEVI